jgi:hypothetical protein
MAEGTNDTRVQDRLFDLRDYFAGQALCGVLSNLSAMRADVRDSAESCATFARDCYRMADAMLAERGRRD